MSGCWKRLGEKAKVRSGLMPLLPGPRECHAWIGNGLLLILKPAATVSDSWLQTWSARIAAGPDVLLSKKKYTSQDSI